MFSQFSGVELAALQTECRCCGSTSSRFVLTIPERIHSVEKLAEAGKSHAQIVEVLCRPA
jgi:hypothetical protein